MKRGVWILISVGIVLILVGVVVILMFIPMGPSLSLPAAMSTPTDGSLLFSESATHTPEVTDSAPAGGCGAGTMTFLALGESLPPRGAEGIRLVRVDFDALRIDVLAVPSSLWLATPGLVESGIGGATLSEVYLHGKTLAGGDEQARMLAGLTQVAGTLAANFGYTPQHYFLLRAAAFSVFVDAIGGIDVTLPAPLDGSAVGLGTFPAGPQHLSGSMAFDLVRIEGAGEWDRFNRQELVITAMYQALLKPENWDRLPALVEAFQETILTDLSVSRMLEISCVLSRPGVVVNQLQIPPEMIVIDGARMLPGADLGAYILGTVGE